MAVVAVCRALDLAVMMPPGSGWAEFLDFKSQGEIQFPYVGRKLCHLFFGLSHNLYRPRHENIVIIK